MGRKKALALALGIIVATSSAWSQEWPARPVRLLVGISPGGLPDIGARILARQLATNLKQGVVVENRPGAGGNIAAKAVATSEPDGYTLLVTGNNHAVNKFLLPDPGFDYERDFIPTAIIAGTRMVLVTAPNVPAATVADIIALARKDPASINFAIAPVGTPGHLAAELFVQMAKTDITFVPYTGIGAAIPDLMAGRVQMAFGAVSAVGQLTAVGSLKAIAISSPTRTNLMPNLPTVSESGLQGFDVDGWLCLLAPAGTPETLIIKINEEIAKANASPDVMESYSKQGISQTERLKPAEVGAYLRTESDKWANVLKNAKAKT
ncbi:MAG: extra-cytoplasmic solute receptor family protein [Hyphomicrobiales bacterium]|nr:extra-cytoplasmic solute receptor family protein [Hyphomicrobiales bacterium]